MAKRKFIQTGLGEDVYVDIDGKIAHIPAAEVEDAEQRIFSEAPNARQVVLAKLKKTDFVSGKSFKQTVRVPVEEFDTFADSAAGKGFEVEYPSPDEQFSPDVLRKRLKERRDWAENRGEDWKKDPFALYDTDKGPTKMGRFMSALKDNVANAIENPVSNLTRGIPVVGPALSQAIDMSSEQEPPVPPAQQVEMIEKNPKGDPFVQPGTGTPSPKSASMVTRRLADADKRDMTRIESLLMESGGTSSVFGPGSAEAIFGAQPKATVQPQFYAREDASFIPDTQDDLGPVHQKVRDAAGFFAMGPARAPKVALTTLAASGLIPDSFVEWAADKAFGDPNYKSKERDSVMGGLWDSARLGTGNLAIELANRFTILDDDKGEIFANIRDERNKAGAKGIRRAESYIGKVLQSAMQTAPYMIGSLASRKSAPKFMLNQAIGMMDLNLREAGVEDMGTRLGIAVPIGMIYAGVERIQSILPFTKQLGNDYAGELAKRLSTIVPNSVLGRLGVRATRLLMTGAGEGIEEPLQEIADIIGVEVGKDLQRALGGKNVDPDIDVDEIVSRVKESFTQGVGVGMIFSALGGGAALPRADVDSGARADTLGQEPNKKPTVADEKGYLTMTEKQKLNADKRLEIKLRQAKAKADLDRQEQARIQEVERIVNDPNLSEEEKSELVFESLEETFQESVTSELGMPLSTLESLNAKMTKGSDVYGQELTEDEARLRKRLEDELGVHGIDPMGPDGRPIWMSDQIDNAGDVGPEFRDMQRKWVIRLREGQADVNTVREEYAEYRIRKLMEADPELQGELFDNMKRYRGWLATKMESLKQRPSGKPGENARSAREAQVIQRTIDKIDRQLAFQEQAAMGSPDQDVQDNAKRALVEFVSELSVQMQARGDIADGGKVLSQRFSDFMKKFIASVRRKVSGIVRQAELLDAAIKKGVLTDKMVNNLNRTTVGSIMPGAATSTQASTEQAQTATPRLKQPAKARPQQRTFKSFDELPSPEADGQAAVESPMGTENNAEASPRGTAPEILQADTDRPQEDGAQTPDQPNTPFSPAPLDPNERRKGDVTRRREVPVELEEERASRYTPKLRSISEGYFKNNQSYLGGMGVTQSQVEEAAILGMAKALGVKTETEQEWDNYAMVAAFNEVNRVIEAAQKRRKTDRSTNVSINDTEGGAEFQDIMTSDTEGLPTSKQLEGAIKEMDGNTREQASERLVEAIRKVANKRAKNSTGLAKKIAQAYATEAKKVASGMRETEPGKNPMAGVQADIAKKVGATPARVSQVVRGINAELRKDPDFLRAASDMRDALRTRSVSYDAVDTIMDVIRKNKDGFTIDVSDGSMVTSGIAVAPAKETESKYDELTEKSVVRYLAEFAGIFNAEERAFLGGWVDSNGQMTLDVSYVVENDVTATYLAELGEQDGIFDISKGKDGYEDTAKAVERLKQSGVYNEGQRDSLQGVREAVRAYIQGKGFNPGGYADVRGRFGQADRQGDGVGGGEQATPGRGDGGTSRALSIRGATRRKGQVDLRHWSGERHGRLKPSFHGTGLRGAERKRKEAWPEHYVNRVYFGGPNYKPEQGLGAYLHEVTIKGDALYDSGKDPDDLYSVAARKAERINGVAEPTLTSTLYEKEISKRYAGYYNGDVAAVFREVPVGQGVLTQRKPGGALVAEESLKAPAKRKKKAEPKLSGDEMFVTKRGATEGVATEKSKGSHAATFGPRAQGAAHGYRMGDHILFTTDFDQDDVIAVENYYARQGRPVKESMSITNPRALMVMNEHGNKRTRSLAITPEQDRAYLAAVDQGDTETAQRMVDEAARAAGYGTKVFHGSPVGGIEVFDTSVERQFGSHVAKGRAVAEEFNNTENGRVYELWLRGNYYDLVSDLGDWADMEMWMEYLPQTELFTESEMLGVRSLSDVRSLFEGKGYDGIKYQTSFEGNPYTLMGTEEQDAYIVFSPSSIKSADPVTRDDQGNVIPLSERFNQNDKRITRSLEVRVKTVEDYEREIPDDAPVKQSKPEKRDRFRTQAFSVISTRLANIHKNLKIAMRNYEQNQRLWLSKWEKQADPLMRELRNLQSTSKQRFRRVTKAMMEGQADAAKDLMREYGLNPDHYEQALKVFGEAHELLTSVGVSMGKIENYFPRRVKDIVGLKKRLEEKHDIPASDIERAMSEAQHKKGDTPLTAFEESEIIAQVVGRLLGQSQGFTHKNQRKMAEIDEDLMDFYADPVETAIKYLENAAELAARNLTLQKLSGTFRDLVKQRINLIDKYNKETDPARQTELSDEIAVLGLRINTLHTSIMDPDNSSIGIVLHDLIQSGDITMEQAMDAGRLMHARFSYRPQGKGWQAIKQTAYATTLGQFKASLRNLADLVPTVIEAGVYRGIKDGILPAAFNSFRGKGVMVGDSYITIDDVLGELNLNEEFVEAGAANRAMRAAFKYSLFNWSDRVGKESLANARIAKIRSLAGKAKAGDEQAMRRLEKELSEVFTIDEINTDKVVTDLASKTKNDAQKRVAFNVLSDYMPVSKIEMPELYLKGGVYQLPYMYRSYLIKFWDYSRRRALKDVAAGWKAGDGARVTKGLAELARIVAYFTATNYAATMLIAAFLNRDEDENEVWFNELANAVGLNRYQMFQLTQKNGLLIAGMSFLAPPLAIAGELANDLIDAHEKGEDWSGPRATRMIPLMGPMLYYGMPFRDTLMRRAGIDRGALKLLSDDLALLDPMASNLQKNARLREMGLPRAFGRGDIMERLYPPEVSKLMRDAEDNDTTIQNRSRYGGVAKRSKQMKAQMDNPDLFYDLAEILREEAEIRGEVLR